MTDIGGSVGGILGVGLVAATGAVVIGGVGNMMVKAAGKQSKLIKKSAKPKSKRKRRVKK